MTFILQESDLEELRNSSSFLSDVLVDFYFNYLKSVYPSDDILFVSPTISFLIANSKDREIVRDCLIALKITSKDLIFFPVNNNGTHWSLLVYFRSLNQFLYHDSLKGMNNQEADKLYLVVKNYVHRKFKRKRMDREWGEPELCFVTDSPQQSNGYDCGLYVMANAEVICRWYYKDYDRDGDWMKELLENVDDKVRQNMRACVLELIHQANLGKLGSVSCKIEETVTDDDDDDGGAGGCFFHSSPFRIRGGLPNFTYGMDEFLALYVKDPSRTGTSIRQEDIRKLELERSDRVGGDFNWLNRGDNTMVWPLTVDAANYIGTLMALMMQVGWILLYKFAAITWKTKSLIRLFNYSNKEKVK